MSFIELTMTGESAKEVAGRVPGRILVRAALVVYANDVLEAASGQRIETMVMLSNGLKFSAEETVAEVISRVQIIEDDGKDLARMQVTTLSAMAKELGRHG